MSAAKALTRLEGVRPCAGGWVARCPAHDDQKASLSLGVGDGGRLLVYCFAGCPYDAIRAVLDGRPRHPIFGLTNASPTPVPALDDAKRAAYALSIWREAVSPTGTLLETYLRSRGITDPVPPSLRFHPSLRHPGGASFPAMVAAVEHVQSGNDIVAIHRTWLAPNGSGKSDLDPPKAALGPIRGGAVRLAPVSETLCLCEGIETGLSILEATGISTWATLGTSNLRAVEVPNAVLEVIIAADADGAGERAAASGGATISATRPQRPHRAP